MKEFKNARVQYTAMDEATEKEYKFSIDDLIEDVDAEVIETIGVALDPLLDMHITEATVTQSHVVLL